MSKGIRYQTNIQSALSIFSDIADADIRYVGLPLERFFVPLQDLWQTTEGHYLPPLQARFNMEETKRACRM